MKRLEQTASEMSLLILCKKSANPSINQLNAQRAPFATTYSDTFCRNAAELIKLYKQLKIADPIDRISKQFQVAAILTCRGAHMSYGNARYLYKKFLLPILAETVDKGI